MKISFSYHTYSYVCVYIFLNSIQFFLFREGMRKTDFPHLHSLMLGGLQSNRILTDFVDVWGDQLTTLKLETVLTVIPLHTIGNCCKSLVELQIINLNTICTLGHT